jgi:hypothetical protein
MTGLMPAHDPTGSAALERPGDCAAPQLISILRAGRDGDELVALGDFNRLPSETVNNLKARIQQEHHAGLPVVAARYRDAG